MLTWLPRDRTRWLTHLVCALLALSSWAVVAWLWPDLRWFHAATIGLGYYALALALATLLIGPWHVWRRQRLPPVNLNLRRDLGIWAGLAGLAHVVLGTQVHLNGDLWQYFFVTPAPTAQLGADLFRLSNYLGLGATLLLAGLLVISNDWSLKKLRGPRWKWLQRTNYALFILTLAHTVGYQLVTKRPIAWDGGVGLLVMFTIGVQLWGVWRVWRQRQQKNGQR